MTSTFSRRQPTKYLSAKTATSALPVLAAPAVPVAASELFAFSVSSQEQSEQAQEHEQVESADSGQGQASGGGRLAAQLPTSKRAEAGGRPPVNKVSRWCGAVASGMQAARPAVS
jgi:hypothetical protein